MTIDELFQLYREGFVLIYTDYLSLTTSKPEQILIEETNVLAHVAQFNNKNIPEELRQQNLDKAYNHLVRATLDLHKLVWAALRERLDILVLDDRKRLCFNSSESAVIGKYNAFITEARKARNNELSSVGVSPLTSIEHYEEVNRVGFDLLNSLDTVKMQRISVFQFKIKSADFLWGVGTGVTTTCIIALVTKFWSALSAIAKPHIP